VTITKLKLQRDRAFILMVISVCLSLSVFRSVYSMRQALEIESVRKSVLTHESILADNEKALHETRLALEAVQRDLAAMKVSGKY
jgi:hypothetical protein